MPTGPKFHLHYMSSLDTSLTSSRGRSAAGMAYKIIRDFVFIAIVVSMASAAQPVTIKNCNLTFTYASPPKRAVTLNQGATEVYLI